MKVFLAPLRFILVLVFCIITASQTAHAHVGSKDVFETINAGPYKLYVTVRMPNVIPGVATVEVRSSGANVSGIQHHSPSDHRRGFETSSYFGSDETLVCGPGFLYGEPVDDGLRLVGGAF